MSRVLRFLKTWKLPVAMLAGAAAYFIYAAIPTPASLDAKVNGAISFIQPVLIFTMLFLTYCKIDFRDLRPGKWTLWLLLIQAGSFALMGLALVLLPDFPARVLVEGAMIAMICPTATAAAVVTSKLGGNMTHIVTYTILINLTVSLMVPAIVPLMNPGSSVSFISAFLIILSKVFPLLILPLAAAWAVKKFLPRLHKGILKYPDAAFYIWLVALALAIAVTVRSIVHSTVSVWYQAGLALISLAACAIQFGLGKKIGGKYGDRTTAGQALGQKNTVLAIWMGCTFFTPVTSIVGGFYSVWHNVVNAWQLYRHEKANS